METDKSHHNKTRNSDETGDEKQLTILVILMLTAVLTLYGIIPFA